MTSRANNHPHSAAPSLTQPHQKNLAAAFRIEGLLNEFIQGVFQNMQARVSRAGMLYEAENGGVVNVAIT